MSELTWTPVKIRLGQIRPWSLNPRLSTKAQAQKIIRSWRNLGQMQTLAVGPMVDGFCDLYDGHQRVAALNTVKTPDYEVLALQSNRPLTDDERREAAVLLHTATGSWNWDSLSAWSAADLREWGMEESTLKGWQADVTALKELLASEKEPVDAEPQVDKAGELSEKWHTQSGQLWKLGDHRLLIGDCTVWENVERLMGGERADCVMTDPPYGMNLNTDYSDMPETRIASKTYDKVEGDDKNFDAMPLIKLFDYVKEQFYWGGDYFYTSLPLGGSWIVWDKRNENSDGLVGNHFEVCWSRVNHRRRIIRVHWSGVNARNQGIAREHPTEKSIKVLSEILGDYTKENALIVDMFAGSGTTIIAAHNLNRRCYAMEISEKYGAVILERFQTATGITPELVDP